MIKCMASERSIPNRILVKTEMFNVGTFKAPLSPLKFNGYLTFVGGRCARHDTLVNCEPQKKITLHHLPYTSQQWDIYFVICATERIWLFSS